MAAIVIIALGVIVFCVCQSGAGIREPRSGYLPHLRVKKPPR